MAISAPPGDVGVTFGGTRTGARHRLGHWSRAVPLSLRRAALTAAVLAGPVGWVTRAAWGLPDRARRAPPPAAPARRRLPALLRRQVPQHPRHPGARPGQHPRRAAAAVARGAARRAARRPDPAGPARAARRGRRARRHLVRARQRAARGRRRAGAGRPGVGAPRLAVAGLRAHPAARAADAARGAAAGRRRPHLARPLRPPGPADGPRAAGDARRRRSSSRSASASTCASGACPRTASSSWTGTSAPRVAGLTLTCTEARHFSGRYFYRDTTLWASWAITGPRHRVFFGGDTGYHPGLRRDRRAAGPVRPDAAAGRRLQRRVARHPHGPGGGRARARRPRRPACCCRSTGPRSTWRSTAGPSRSQRTLAAAGGAGHRGRRPAARRADRRAGPAAADATGGRRSARPRRTPTASTPRARAARCWCAPRPGCCGSATEQPRSRGQLRQVARPTRSG